MAQAEPNFVKPNLFEAFFNRALGLFVGIGLGPKDYYLLKVRGRKSGRVYATPVSIIEYDGCRYVVAPRGNTQWVRNARTAGRIALCAGWKRDRFEVREIPAADRPPILKSYLARYAKFVQRYFQVQNGAPEAEFAAVAGCYPVFELIPAVA
ncbi:MAG TPA: nitroreductase/quinone reductase family protein [Candidatus Binataceae bacterium]|nr:nitroreductase/quinone reductase family protein [Candidatus Binataceae bacterium]